MRLGVLQLTGVGHGLVHLLEGTLPALFPLLLVHFGVDYLRLGLAATLFSYTFGLGSLPAGYLIDRLGSRRPFLLFLFATGVVSLTVVLVNRFSVFVAYMALLGATASLYHPSGSTMISVELGGKGRAFAIHGIAGSLGIAMAPLAAGTVGFALGWRIPYAVLGIFAVAFGLLVARQMTEPVVKRREESKTSRSESPVMMSWLTVAMFASFATLGMAYKAAVTFLPAYLVEVLGAESALPPILFGSGVATVVLIAGVAGQFIGGSLADKCGPERCYFVGSLFAGVLAFGMARVSGLALFGVAVAQAFFAFSTLPIKNILIARHVEPDAYGRAFGVKYFMVFGVGAIAAVVGGYLGDRIGLHAVYTATGILCLVSAVLAAVLLFLPKRDVTR